MQDRNVRLNELGLKCLFVGMVCTILEKSGFKGDCFNLANSLDMSFEEIAPKDIAEWGYLIGVDLAEFKAENPHEFETQH